MLKLAVIGDPISHSLSPEIHHEILNKLGVSCDYSAVHIRKGALEEWVGRAVTEGYHGFNVTMPHKQDIMKFLESIDAEAELCGAVNTVTVKNGKLYGHNTDGNGLRMSLAEHGAQMRGKNILIAGTGGASLTMLRKANADGAKTAAALGRNELYRTGELAAETDIFINATPLGMHGCGDQWQDLNFIEKFPKHCVVLDMIYNPFKTKLLTEAEKRGLTVINGLGMLVCQAVLADEIFISEM